MWLVPRSLEAHTRTGTARADEAWGFAPLKRLSSLILRGCFMAILKRRLR